MRVDSQAIGTPKPPQSYFNATLNATPRLQQSHPLGPSSHPGLGQVRNPKVENRRKSETRSPKEDFSGGLGAFWSGFWLEFRISGFLRLCGLASLREGDGELGALIHLAGDGGFAAVGFDDGFRSEERRVGKEGRSRWSP